MTTLTPAMSLTALLKAGCTIDVNGKSLRFYGFNGYVILEHRIRGLWCQIGEFPLDKEGIGKCLDYVNLPF